jgi:glycosyltransferase domain-containing protein
MPQPSLDQLTCVIPTHNRPAFLRRLLGFIEQTGQQYAIRICDSSDSVRRAENEQAIKEFSGNCRITYEHLSVGVFPKCRKTMEKITTPYTVFCADDDFLMPDAVLRCVDFLEKSASYSCAQGAMVSLATAKQNKCYLLTNYSLESPSPIRRFKQFATNWYSTFYSVCRTPILTQVYQVVDSSSDYDRARIFPEILHSQMTVIPGRVKYLPGFYNLREEHELNDSRLPIVQDLEHSEEHYSQFQNCLATELSQVSGEPLAKSKAAVDSCYGYLRDGGIGLENRKRTISYRVKREFKRQIRRMTDFVRHDQILQRRRISRDATLCQTEHGQLAFELMLKYPNGIIKDAAETA